MTEQEIINFFAEIAIDIPGFDSKNNQQDFTNAGEFQPYLREVIDYLYNYDLLTQNIFDKLIALKDQATYLTEIFKLFTAINAKNQIQAVVGYLLQPQITAESVESKLELVSDFLSTMSLKDRSSRAAVDSDDEGDDSTIINGNELTQINLTALLDLSTDQITLINTAVGVIKKLKISLSQKKLALRDQNINLFFNNPEQTKDILDEILEQFGPINFDLNFPRKSLNPTCLDSIIPTVNTQRLFNTDNPQTIHERRPEYSFSLVLDLDETLVSLSEHGEFLALRPYAKKFLKKLRREHPDIEIIFWTAATRHLAEIYIEALDPDHKLTYGLISRGDTHEFVHWQCPKDLEQIAYRDSASMLLVDDREDNCSQNPGRAIQIMQFNQYGEHAANDQALPGLYDEVVRRKKYYEDSIRSAPRLLVNQEPEPAQQHGNKSPEWMRLYRLYQSGIFRTEVLATNPTVITASPNSEDGPLATSKKGKPCYKKSRPLLAAIHRPLKARL